jgi:uncharacterized protein YcfJ
VGNNDLIEGGRGHDVGGGAGDDVVRVWSVVDAGFEGRPIRTAVPAMTGRRYGRRYLSVRARRRP